MRNPLCRECDTHTCTYFRERKKESQGDRLPNVCTKLVPVKTSLFDLLALHPALSHSKEDLHAVDLKVPAVKRHEHMGAINKVPASYFLTDLKGYIWIDSYKHRKNTFVPVYRLWDP